MFLTNNIQITFFLYFKSQPKWFFLTITQKSEYDNFKAAQANADILYHTYI